MLSTWLTASILSCSLHEEPSVKEEIIVAIECVTEKAPANVKQQYYQDYMLEDYADAVLHFSNVIGFSPWTFVVWNFKESWWRYDAVSRGNGIDIGDNPWLHPQWGLDWGISQIHCPSRWCKKKKDIIKLLDVWYNLEVLSEWFVLRGRNCRYRPFYSNCREIENITGDAFYNTDPPRIRYHLNKLRRCVRKYHEEVSG